MCAPKQPLMFQEFPTRSPSFGNSPSPSRSTWHKCNVGQGGSQLCNDYILLRTSRGESCSRQVQHTAGSAASLSVSPSAFFSTLPSPSKSTASCIDCPETNKLWIHRIHRIGQPPSTPFSYLAIWFLMSVDLRRHDNSWRLFKPVPEMAEVTRTPHINSDCVSHVFARVESAAMLVCCKGSPVYKSLQNQSISNAIWSTWPGFNATRRQSYTNAWQTCVDNALCQSLQVQTCAAWTLLCPQSPKPLKTDIAGPVFPHDKESSAPFFDPTTSIQSYIQGHLGCAQTCSAWHWCISSLARVRGFWQVRLVGDRSKNQNEFNMFERSFLPDLKKPCCTQAIQASSSFTTHRRTAVQESQGQKGLKDRGAKML